MTLSDIIKLWDKWENSLIQKVEIPRSIVQSNGATKIDLRAFFELSKVGSCAVEYVVIFVSCCFGQFQSVL